MNKMELSFGLMLMMALSACQSMPVTPISTPNELAPYYGSPKPIKIIIDGKTYDSGIGTTQWIREAQPDGVRVMEIGDAFAIITPTEPIPMTLNPSFTLKLPIPVNPTELWYILYKVSEQELAAQDSSHGVLAWNPDYKTQAYLKRADLSLSSKQEMTFSLDGGIYVFEVHASWGGIPPQTELEADYGFLIEAKE